MIVELHLKPPTEDGRLVTRSPGNGELFVGVSCDEGGRAHLFEIELHRWRDGFGPQANGPLQVRGESGWIDLAYVCPGPAPPPLPPPPPPWWRQWIDELNQAVASGDSTAVELLARRCLDRSAWPLQSVVAADLLAPAVACATLAILSAPEAYSAPRGPGPPGRSSDLPDAQILDLILAFRSALSPRDDGRWTPNNLGRLTAEIPKERGRDLLLAEAYYRYAWRRIVLPRRAGTPASFFARNSWASRKTKLSSWSRMRCYCGEFARHEVRFSIRRRRAQEGCPSHPLAMVQVARFANE